VFDRNSGLRRSWSLLVIGACSVALSEVLQPKGAHVRPDVRFAVSDSRVAFVDPNRRSSGGDRK
jgi:hypothetical protein